MLRSSSILVALVVGLTCVIQAETSCIYQYKGKNLDFSSLPVGIFQDGLNYDVHPCKTLNGCSQAQKENEDNISVSETNSVETNVGIDYVVSEEANTATEIFDVEFGRDPTAGCNVYQLDGAGQCNCLGMATSVTWSLLTVEDKVVGVVANSTGGDSKRTAEVKIVCSKKTAVIKSVSEKPTLHYNFEYTSPIACKVVPGYKSGGGGGGIGGVAIFDIIIVCSLSAFLIFGSLYNWKVKGQVGTAAIPLRDFWKELPSLVKDGCLFTYGTAKILFYRLTGRTETI